MHQPVTLSFYTNPPQSRGNFCAAHSYPRGTKLEIKVNGKIYKLTVSDYCPRDRIDIPSRFAPAMRGYDLDHRLGIRKAIIFKVTPNDKSSNRQRNYFKNRKDFNFVSKLKHRGSSLSNYKISKKKRSRTSYQKITRVQDKF